MYDSDEVRDAVRREMWEFRLTPGAEGVPLSAEELAAIDEPFVAFGRKLATALDEHVREQVERDERVRAAVVALMERVAEVIGEAVRPLLEALGALARAVGEQVREFAAAIGVWEEGNEGDEGDEFPWRRRPRVAEVRPLRVVDAVAAGRGPVMSMRTRIRGGRR